VVDSSGRTKALAGLSGHRSARGEAPLGFAEVNDEVVVEYDDPDLGRDERADWSRAMP